jgi:transposase
MHNIFNLRDIDVVIYIIFGSIKQSQNDQYKRRYHNSKNTSEGKSANQ